MSLTTLLLPAVIIQSLKDTPPLTDDSIIFRSDRLAVGKVGGPAGAVCIIVYLCFMLSGCLRPVGFYIVMSYLCVLGV